MVCKPIKNLGGLFFFFFFFCKCSQSLDICLCSTCFVEKTVLLDRPCKHNQEIVNPKGVTYTLICVLCKYRVIRFCKQDNLVYVNSDVKIINYRGINNHIFILSRWHLDPSKLYAPTTSKGNRSLHSILSIQIYLKELSSPFGVPKVLVIQMWVPDSTSLPSA